MTVLVLRVIVCLFASLLFVCCWRCLMLLVLFEVVRCFFFGCGCHCRALLMIVGGCDLSLLMSVSGVVVRLLLFVIGVIFLIVDCRW